MAIKIINKEPSPTVVKEVICRNCGVTLSYTPNDVTTETRKDYTGDSTTYKYILCPNCHANVIVDVL